MRNLVLAKNIKARRDELDALLEKDAGFKAKEDSLLADIEAAQTKEEREAVESAVDEFDAEVKAHEQAKAELTATIEALESELSALEQQPLPAPAQPVAELKNERMNTMLPANLDIRALPMSCRAFDALPLDQRKSIVAQEDVQNFLAQLRGFSKARASVTGAELTIPVIFLDIINQNRFRYSKLLRRVRMRTVRGEARQTIGGTIPEAVWTECCGALNELNFVFNQVVMECYK
ncbi:MAG: phage major capsid protein, partial [Oscillospiraceae bacterium]|nr:phage major capsid protein [Oscillospiraceae bacterium]